MFGQAIFDALENVSLDVSFCERRVVKYKGEFG